MVAGVAVAAGVGLMFTGVGGPAGLALMGVAGGVGFRWSVGGVPEGHDGQC